MLDIKTHRSILVQILKEIYSRTSLGPILGFKGGTSVYLFYNLPRFSVDLDFDLVYEKKEDFVFNEIEKILKDFGEIRDKANKRNTIFFILSYSDESRNIKIKISKRNFGSEYEIKNYLGISMLVMKNEDIFAHKLAALLERKKQANRDLFDIWFFLKNNWEINKKIIEIRTKMDLKNYLKKCIAFIEKLSEKNILTGIGELLDEKNKTWAKKNLKKDLLFLLRLRLKNL